MDKLRISRLRTDEPVQRNFYKHCHNDYELFFFIEGDAHFIIEGLRYKLTPFTLLFIKPAKYHYLQLDSVLPYDRYVTNFWEEDVPKEIFERIDKLNPCYYLAKDDDVVNLFFKLDRYKSKYSPEDYSILTRQILSEIVLNLIYRESAAKKTKGSNKTLAAIPPTPIDPIVMKTIRYIDNNLTNILDLEQISGAMFVSKSYLSHIFNKYMKTGVMKYVKHKKILFAQSLLQQGIPPTEVCNICGFRDYSTFYRLYKDILKTTPSKAK